MARKTLRLILGSRVTAAVALIVVIVAIVLAAAFALRDPELGFELTASQRGRAATTLDAMIGATVEPLDRATAESLGLAPRDEGLVITSLGENGPAARAGLRAGDVIERIGEVPVGPVGDATAALKGVRPPEIVLTLNRRGHYTIVHLPIHSAPDMRDLGKQGGDQ